MAGIKHTNRPGIGIDSGGGQVIDPTKNVEDLVKARDAAFAELRASDQRFLDAQLSAMDKLQTFARDADSRLQTFARESGEKLESALRDAETKRINELASTRKDYENTIRDMLAESVRSTSTLVSTQLVQIQATFDARVSKLEAFQWQSTGRSSVADPALASALADMATSIQGLTKSETKVETRREGIISMGGLVVGVAFIISTLVSISALILSLVHH